ncbi:MAG: HEAT repeat domain-containing protein [Candidatus Margulisiibacteriota bacterium]
MSSLLTAEAQVPQSRFAKWFVASQAHRFLPTRKCLGRNVNLVVANAAGRYLGASSPGKLGGIFDIQGLRTHYLAIVLQRNILGLREAPFSYELQAHRLDAVKALAVIGDASTVPALVAILNCKEEAPDMRYAACYALGRIGGNAAADALTQRLYHDVTEEKFHMWEVQAEALIDISTTKAGRAQAQGFLWTARLLAAVMPLPSIRADDTRTEPPKFLRNTCEAVLRKLGQNALPALRLARQYHNHFPIVVQAFEAMIRELDQ